MGDAWMISLYCPPVGTVRPIPSVVDDGFNRVRDTPFHTTLKMNPNLGVLEVLSRFTF